MKLETKTEYSLKIHNYIYNGAIRDCEELLKYRGTYNPLIS